jgi:hypothetical protein
LAFQKQSPKGFFNNPEDGDCGRTARGKTDDKRKDQYHQGDNPGCATAYEYMNGHQHHRHEPGNDEDIGDKVQAGTDTHRNTHCNQVHVVVYRRYYSQCRLIWTVNGVGRSQRVPETSEHQGFDSRPKIWRQCKRALAV